ncbi:hypothetical protein I5M32_16350 [Pedobacter sp. SD-b]|uniref:SusD family protein n=1 Tax=Pedobacter segetis TaxID=2793069 RepID=A0ABS1BQ17_9SPHI|nr:hypothetical protein [Pedobacter segetis]MBK0384534.1 hypothetical protein [Pedobacter segetis]
MVAENKYSETGSNPYYLNLNNTAKDISLNDTTNPQYGLLDTLSRFIIVENSLLIQEPQLQQGQFPEISEKI